MYRRKYSTGTHTQDTLYSHINGPVANSFVASRSRALSPRSLVLARSKSWSILPCISFVNKKRCTIGTCMWMYVNVKVKVKVKAILILDWRGKFLKKSGHVFTQQNVVLFIQDKSSLYTSLNISTLNNIIMYTIHHHVVCNYLGLILGTHAFRKTACVLPSTQTNPLSTFFFSPRVSTTDCQWNRQNTQRLECGVFANSRNINIWPGMDSWSRPIFDRQN